MSIETTSRLNDSEMPDVLPILTLRNAVLFPSTVMPITVGREKSMKLVRDAYKSNKILGAVSQMDVMVEDPAIIDLFSIGTLARILKIIEMPNGDLTVILQGIKRFNLVEQTSDTPYLFAKVAYLEEIGIKKNDKDIDSLSSSLKETAIQILKLSPNIPQEAAFAIKNLEGEEFMINFIASSIEIENPLDKIQLLMESRLKVRAMKLLSMMNRQLEILKLKDDIQQKARSEMNQQQREYFLNNQLRTIQEELGMDESQDFEDLRKKAARKDWPQHAADAFANELRKLERTNPSSPDYNVQYQYIKLLVDLPWNHLTKDNLDLAHARKVLD
ncbi:MAG: LON peptidase substrate-binding domain-containing protein, partial [Alistipes sp.]|nr:LON peptidase substrate-binding domain-containing protein [Candidatus Minthomonas equi]